MPTDLAYDIGHRGLSGPGKDLHTGVWHGDRVFDLPAPVDWQITALWPPTPPTLTDNQIAGCLGRPVGQSAIAAACAGKLRPLVIVDSTTEPTPVARLLPHLLWQLNQVGIEPAGVRILVATGLHGVPRPESLLKKLGPAAAECELLIHDPQIDTVEVGTIAPGIRLTVNREVMSSDYVIGMEGIYPNADDRLAPGSKIVTGVLGLETIHRLSSQFPARGSSEREWRATVDEIAERLRVHTMVSAQVDSDRNLVRLACGDPSFYYPGELAFARATFRAPLPDDAEVVVANAYPADLSLAAVLDAALNPLRYAARRASRILLASCAEGAGFVKQRRSWWPAVKTRAGFGEERRRPAGSHEHPIWLYRPGQFPETVPAKIGDVRLAPSWEFIVNTIGREQANKKFCRVYLYPCSPLQLLMRPSGP